MDKRCFIITPIGDELSETRLKAEGVIESIEPILEEFDFKVDIPHKMPSPGSITKQVLECIMNNDLVVANLTELNPNVMYELAVRHSTAKHVITIAEFGTKLPFDITTERTIFYTNDMKGVPKLQREIRGAIKSLDFNESAFDNPIYRAQRDFKFKEDNVGGINEYIIDVLDEVKNTQTRILEEITPRSPNSPNSPSSMRIVKAARQFNVPISELVNILISKGYKVEANPNFKITNEMYNNLCDYYNSKRLGVVVKGAIDLNTN
jgi:hypothetical protein